jgi:hypothetical protein
MKFIYSLLHRVNCALFPKAREEAANWVYRLSALTSSLPETEEESTMADRLADAYEAYVTRFGVLPVNPNPRKYKYPSQRPQEDWDAYYADLHEELAEIAQEYK